ncbi:uncharacterized protein M437DRAFT_37403 [Aureobasidium melanogenum CBS 110374]|uniref:Uncharacterized protein n=1 Tax=Aureobasidium melanogenum (strain CBS 110374) TaxID=1043003 RepID=A0A074W342_AURM1|nr:uncharacterized protein M437DRAFT_37403 [Aureobasidium melanogenum CBS 110374]KEQ67228.1 hypothetical protein M437DRAFT_37403 [Aureobasidium melanogenum CBS 110374]
MAGSSGSRADSPIFTTIEVDNYDEYNDKNDFKRRISNITTTSVSSFPDSAWPSDSDVHPTAKPRPAYRVGSIRRSHLPERLSPSSLRPSRHSPHRPRSRGEGGRPRSKGEDITRRDEPSETPAPLVLLHVTVLPPRLPWNRTVLDATLPIELKRQFGVLRAATSGLVAQRGILIAHPREEFELLEESVLEALDLLPERIGYDGQYRPRTPSTVVEGDADDEEETDVQPCDTCQRVHVGDAWSVRVYAANGLMRAGAWAACWSEMERVDCEVRPCISERISRSLDEMQLAEDIANERGTHRSPETQHTSPTTSRPTSTLQNDLPPIYRPKDVPLGLLLRNYLYLVLRDRRNIAICILGLTLLASTFHGVFAMQASDTSNTGLVASNVEAVSELPILPVASPRTDVGHGKRHPMWTTSQGESRKDVESQRFSPADEKSEFDQTTGPVSRSVTEDQAIQPTVAAATSLVATNLDISAETSSTRSPNPAFLPFLQGRNQCSTNDQQP